MPTAFFIGFLVTSCDEDSIESNPAIAEKNML